MDLIIPIGISKGGRVEFIDTGSTCIILYWPNSLFYDSIKLILLYLLFHWGVMWPMGLFFRVHCKFSSMNLSLPCILEWLKYSQRLVMITKALPRTFLSSFGFGVWIGCSSVSKKMFNMYSLFEIIIIYYLFMVSMKVSLNE